MTNDEVVRNNNKINFDEKRQEFYNNFKQKLNDFMYKYVPGKLTIDEFEELTCDILQRVDKEWNKFI